MGTLWQDTLVASYEEMEEPTRMVVQRIVPSVTVGFRLHIYNDIARKIESDALDLDDDDCCDLLLWEGSKAESFMQAVGAATFGVARGWAEQSESMWSRRIRSTATRIASFPQEDARGWGGLDLDERSTLAYWLLTPVQYRVVLCAYEWVAPGRRQLQDLDRTRIRELCHVETDEALHQLKHRAAEKMRRIWSWLAGVTDRANPQLAIPLLPEVLMAALRNARRDPKRPDEPKELYATLAWLRSQVQ